MLIGHQRPNDSQAIGRRAAPESLGEATDDTPIRASVRQRRRTTLLMLDSAFEVGQRGLALVGVGHRQHDFDAWILRHRLRRGQDRLRSHVCDLRASDLLVERPSNWGDRYPTRWLIKTLIEHDLYHAGQINYAAPGVGSMGHLAAELFKRTAQIEMEHIAYKGGGPAVTDLLDREEGL